jgi:predicted ATP-grasp superfamily ATP-dependent carboligase
MASRYCAGTIELPPFGADAASRAAAVEALAAAGAALRARHGAPAPLFYGDDEQLSLVQDHRAGLAPHFALLLNEPSLGDALLDKKAFQALAERAGLPVPRRIDVRRLQAERSPVLAKPKVKTAWDSSSVHLQLFAGAGKARIYANGAEAAADPLVRSLAGQLAFQEYIPGGDDAIWSFHGFAAPDGEILAWFVGRKIRTYPELTGDSAYLRLDHDDAVAALGFELARRLGLAGVFKMDFKRDAASGKLYLLEINARYNLWHYLGARNGVNLAKVAYEFLTAGRRPPPAAAQARCRWLSLRNDWRAYKELSARGRLNFARWLLSLAYVPKVYETFSWTDPMPFLRYWNTRLRSAAARRLHRWHATAS